MAEKYSEKMPTRGIRMPDEQWKMCQEMSEELGYRYPSDFIRDAIDFYVEWKKSDSAEKFLTPALESVVRGIVKDSEDRISRLLFKLSVEISTALDLPTRSFEASTLIAEPLLKRQ